MNVEARTVSGQEYASKAALKRAILADPTDVVFRSTSAFTPGEFRASEMPYGVRLDIVGPNAFTNRRYYGTALRETCRIPDSVKIRVS
jgi:hypothetical protein